MLYRRLLKDIFLGLLSGLIFLALLWVAQRTAQDMVTALEIF